MTDTNHQIRAILFDLGETLLMFGRVSTIRLFRKGARLAYDYLKNLNQPVGSFEYYCWKNLVILRFYNLISTITGNDFDSMTLLKKIGAKSGIKLNDDQWRQMIWLIYQPLSQAGRPEPDIVRTLTELKQMGLKLGIVSNTFVSGLCLDRHLEQTGILDFFELRMYSYQFDFRKPDIRIFRTAAEKIREPLENILFVGDRIDNDIKPAVRAGMQTALKTAYTNIGRKIPTGVWKINNLSELPALVTKVNQTNG